MAVPNMTKAINILLLAWFILTPLFWHLDLSRGGTFDFYDTFVMAPYAIFHMVIFYSLSFLSLYFSQITLYHILLFSLYFPYIQLANYPYLTIRDVYLHAAPAKTILVNGELTHLKNPEVVSWPASFGLHSILSIISGCDLVSSNYILYVSLILALAFAVYSFAKTLEKKGYQLARASAILFLCLFYSHFLDPFTHFSRTGLAFTLLFFFIFSFICLKDRGGCLFQLLMSLSILTTHPFQSLALIAFMFSYSVLIDRVKRRDFAVFSIIAFSSWFLWNAYSSSVKMIDLLRSSFSAEYFTPMVETFAVGRALPWWGIVLRDYYKYSLISLLAIAFFVGIMILCSGRRNDTIIIGLTSLMFSSIVILFSLLILREWKIIRFTAFAAFPAAFSSLVLLDKILTKENSRTTLYLHNLFTQKATSAILLIFIVSLSATVMVLRFESNYYFGEVLHPSELSSLSFFFTYERNSTVYIASWRTNVYSPYFNYNLSHQTLMLWAAEIEEIGKNQSKLLLSVSHLINHSQFVIRGMRDEFDLFRLDSPKTTLKLIEDEMILPKFNSVYSNGYYSIYHRSVGIP